jgi:hypothetical protein
LIAGQGDQWPDRNIDHHDELSDSNIDHLDQRSNCVIDHLDQRSDHDVETIRHGDQYQGLTTDQGKGVDWRPLI